MVFWLRLRAGKSQFAFDLEIQNVKTHHTPFQEGVQLVCPWRNPSLDFVFDRKSEDPGFRIKIRISQSKAPLVTFT